MEHRGVLNLVEHSGVLGLVEHSVVLYLIKHGIVRSKSYRQAQPRRSWQRSMQMNIVDTLHRLTAQP